MREAQAGQPRPLDAQQRSARGATTTCLQLPAIIMPFPQATAPRDPPRLLEREAAAWLILVFTTALTLVLWDYSQTHRSVRALERFEYRSEKEISILRSRLQAYEQVLLGGAAFFNASEQVSRQEWHDYVEQLNLDATLPGIQGTGFALIVRARDKSAHEQAMRAAGFADYRIQPEGERDPYSSITYLEPFSDRNLRAFGYDMYSEPVRREAMDRARDSGTLALSGKVTLVQETDSDIQPGFLMYVPVYAKSVAVDDLASRRDHIFGYVYSPFRAHDLMRAIFGESNKDIEIELFDDSPAPANLLFASADANRAAAQERELTLVFGGRQWIARVRSSAEFDESANSDEPLLILIGGLALDTLLFAVILGSARHRRRMQAAAAQIAESRDRFQTLVENVPGTVFRTAPAPPWHALHVSRGIENLTGEPPERFLSGAVSCRAHLHPDDAPDVLGAITQAVTDHTTYNVEYRVRGADGVTRWASERGRASYDSSGTPLWIDGVILDVTDRKIAELAIRDLAFYDPLTGLPNRRLLMDRLQQQLSVSARSGLYGALLFADLDKFKTINDTLGHQIGDQLLTEVAHRLRATVREGDTVARLGGDEFVVMLEDLGRTRDEATALAANIATKILHSLARPYALKKQTVQCTPSIGLAAFRGHELSVDELIRRADEAMYRAKSEGRNRLHVFRGEDH